MTASPEAESFGELLWARAERRPETLAYRFIAEPSAQPIELSYGELLQRVRTVAGGLAERVPAGGRVLLLCSTGLPYVIAFHACQAIGAIAVPAYPPRGNRHGQRIAQIVSDCEPQAIVTDADQLEPLQALVDALLPADARPLIASMESLQAADRACGGPMRRAGSDVSFLQYTSGSTGSPKGVVVSHANLLANLAGISRKFEVDESYNTVFWLPPYHDMGLVGGILHPLFGGYPVTLMSPFLFLQSPIRWLQAMSDYRATASAAPNFGYQQCVDRVRPEQCEGLDFSAWSIAICGAERVLRRTMEGFAARLAPFGFDPAALYPTYGMAEATLMVSGGRKGGGFRVLESFAPPGGQGAAHDDVVSCGTVLEGHALAIVEADRQSPVEPGSVGEIWLAGPSVAQGYWKKPEGDFFGALPDDDTRYLKTGDLGVVVDGELYLLGRSKEMIIVRGANFYPTDLEQAVAGAHPAINGSAVAAFAVQRDEGEALVLALEIRREARHAPLDEIRRHATRALVESFDIRPAEVVVLKPQGMLRTSSGKIRRREMAQAYSAGALPVYEPLPAVAGTAAGGALPQERR